MKKIQRNIIPRIEKVYSLFTDSERKVADFFMNNREAIDLSAKSMSALLYVSEATLSRFSKKMGFSGYREFIFYYEGSLNYGEMRFTGITQNLLFSYNELLNHTISLVDENQIRKLAYALSKYQRVYVYGEGNSALCAQEFKMRFMRLGLHVEAISDQHIMKMNSVLMSSSAILIAFSVSGKNLRDYLSDAQKMGAYTVMVTAHNDTTLQRICDEVIVCPSIKNVEIGNLISPQFPLLLIIDILYAHYLNLDYSKRSEVLNETLNYVERENETNHGK